LWDFHSKERVTDNPSVKYIVGWDRIRGGFNAEENGWEVLHQKVFMQRLGVSEGQAVQISVGGTLKPEAATCAKALRRSLPGI
jgi:hypothetical protein